MTLALTSVDSAWHLLSAGRFDDAAKLARKLLTVEPDNPSTLCCAAMAEWELGYPVDGSIALLEQAVRLAPRNAAIRHNLATLQASMGDMPAARASFEAALDIRPDDTMAFFGLAQNCRFTEENDIVRSMLSLYGSGMLNRQGLEFVCFGLAKVYADLGLRARAMHFCLEANWLAERTFNRDGERRRLQILTDQAEAGTIPIARGQQPGAAPVFIVGMPRSGTTLVEAILSRHSQIQANGETELLSDLEHDLMRGDATRLSGLSRDQLRARSETALRTMRDGAAADIRVVTDKTPDNAFRVGLIAALFPQARIIHVRRHPLDCGLSNLFTRFTAGQGFAFRQVDLGERIRHTADIMATWKRTLPLPILDLSYEMLVAEPEAQSRRLIDFVGLDWDEACLSPELARRQMQTASQWQVRQKIYTNSVGRFQGYEEWLEPLTAAMGGADWIAAEVEDQLRAG